MENSELKQSNEISEQKIENKTVEEKKENSPEASIETPSESIETSSESIQTSSEFPITPSEFIETSNEFTENPSESIEIKTQDANTTNCLALTIQEDHKITALKNVFFRTIRMSWKVAVSTITLALLKLFS